MRPLPAAPPFPPPLPACLGACRFASQLLLLPSGRTAASPILTLRISEGTRTRFSLALIQHPFSPKGVLLARRVIPLPLCHEDRAPKGREGSSPKEGLHSQKRGRDVSQVEKLHVYPYVTQEHTGAFTSCGKGENFTGGKALKA